MKVKIKKLVKHAQIPEYANSTDAGLDLIAVDQGYKNHDHDYVEYGTGLAVEIPEGYVGLIFPRSSISKTPHMLANSVGVIDSGYRGEIKVRFRNLSEKEYLEYSFGDKIAQLIIIPFPRITFQEVEQLSESDRGTGGFGSTGKRAKAEVVSTDDLLDPSEDLDYE